MSKILIVDDRVNRQLQQFGKSNVNLISGNCDNRTSLPDYEKESSYDFENKLNGYSLIAVHLSWLKENRIQNEIIDYAKKNSKYLIVFSGGISQTNMIEKYILFLNSKDFYSENLVNLVSSELDDKCLYKVLYGDKWELCLLLRYRQIIWLYSNEEDSVEDIKGRIEGTENDQLIDEFKMLKGVFPKCIRFNEINKKISEFYTQM